nr:hypothetical protein [Tanacetum cinerariifolium]
MSGSEPGEMAPESSQAVAQAKRAGEGNSEVTRKKRIVHRDQDPDRSGSKRVLSHAPLYHAALGNAKYPHLVVQDDATGDTAIVEREVVDLSGNIRVATPSATVNQPSPRLDHYDTQEHHDTHEPTAFVANSFHSTQHADTKEEAADRRFVPNWGLRDELLDRVKDLEKERDDGRRTASDQVERIRGLEEREKVLEAEKVSLQDKTYQAKKDRHWLVQKFIPASLGRTEDDTTRMLSETRDLDIEGSKSWEAKHRELFTMQ